MRGARASGRFRWFARPVTGPLRMEREEAARDAVEGTDPNGLCGDGVLHGDRTVVKERLQRKSKRAEALEAHAAYEAQLAAVEAGGCRHAGATAIASPAESDLDRDVETAQERRGLVHASLEQLKKYTGSIPQAVLKNAGAHYSYGGVASGERGTVAQQCGGFFEVTACCATRGANTATHL